MTKFTIFGALLFFVLASLLTGCSGNNYPDSSKVALKVQFQKKSGKMVAATAFDNISSLNLSIIPQDPAEILSPSSASQELTSLLRNGQSSVTIDNLGDGKTYFFKIVASNYGDNGAKAWIGSNLATLNSNTVTPVTVTVMKNDSDAYDAALPTYYAAARNSVASPSIDLQVQGSGITSATVVSATKKDTLYTLLDLFNKSITAEISPFTASQPLYDDGNHADFAPKDGRFELRLNGPHDAGDSFTFQINFTNAFGQPDIMTQTAILGSHFTEGPTWKSANLPHQSAGADLLLSWTLPANSGENVFNDIHVNYWTPDYSVNKEVLLPATATGFTIPGTDIIDKQSYYVVITLMRKDTSGIYNAKITSPVFSFDTTGAVSAQW